MPSKTKPKVVSPRFEGGETTMVSELIDQVYRVCREDVIDQVFYESEASIIKNIPPCRSIQDDVLI